LQPVKSNIYKLLKSRGVNPSLFSSHIKVLPIGNRQLVGKLFNRVSESLLQFRPVGRKQSNMSLAKLRRLIKRASISEQEAKQYKAKMFTKGLKKLNWRVAQMAIGTGDILNLVN